MKTPKKKKIKNIRGIKLPKFMRMVNVKVRTKLLIFFLLIGIVPIMIVGYVSYKGAEETIETEVGRYSKQLINQTVDNVDSIIREMENSTMSIVTNQQLVNLLGKTDYDDSFQQLMDEREIESTFLNIILANDDIQGIMMCRTNGETISSGDVSGVDDDFVNSNAYKTVMAAGGSPVWITALNDSYENIYLMRRLMSLSSGKVAGVIVYIMKESVFCNIYKDIELSEQADIMLVDNSTIISSLDQE
ncbi:MAG TPA: cache domain-containing protein, partial [Halanaerobiales bacterium]|nr:cache domain-containing protein [Halanaerobiales bacterium]